MPKGQAGSGARLPSAGPGLPLQDSGVLHSGPEEKAARRPGGPQACSSGAIPGKAGHPPMSTRLRVQARHSVGRGWCGASLSAPLRPGWSASSTHEATASHSLHAGQPPSPAPGLRVPTLPLDHRQVDPGHPQSQSRDAGRECTGTDPREKMPSLLSPSSCWQVLLLPQDGRSSKAYTFAPPFPPSSASPTLSFPIPWVKEPGPSEWLEK